jgi:hypothetical protein
MTRLKSIRSVCVHLLASFILGAKRGVWEVAVTLRQLSPLTELSVGPIYRTLLRTFVGYWLQHLKF